MIVANNFLPVIKVVAHTKIIIIGVCPLGVMVIQKVGVGGANPTFPDVKSIGVSIMPTNAHNIFRLEHLRLLLLKILPRPILHALVRISPGHVMFQTNSDWYVDSGALSHMTPQ